MYTIMTKMYGPKIPEDLNIRAQDSEASEILLEIKVDGFTSDVPYSGSDYADLHIGINLSRLGTRSKVVTKDAKTKYREGIELFIGRFSEILDQSVDSTPEDAEFKKVASELLDFIKNSKPEIYYAYSTS